MHVMGRRGHRACPSGHASPPPHHMHFLQKYRPKICSLLRIPAEEITIKGGSKNFVFRTTLYSKTMYVLLADDAHLAAAYYVCTILKWQ